MKHIEQLPSSKNLSEAHREILTKHDIIMALSNRCVHQGWLRQSKKSKTSKDSYNARRSKQNACYVTNKNIAPSKITDDR